MKIYVKIFKRAFITVAVTLAGLFLINSGGQVTASNYIELILRAVLLLVPGVSFFHAFINDPHSLLEERVLMILCYGTFVGIISVVLTALFRFLFCKARQYFHNNEIEVFLAICFFIIPFSNAFAHEVTVHKKITVAAMQDCPALAPNALCV